MRWFADKYLRIDARSLGLFRIAMGLVLIADLFHRWDWIEAFYTNEGVLPNHNHLFLLQDEGKVWSVYHAFSSMGEAQFAFVVTFTIYLFFTVGWFTRAAHVVSLVCLIGLTGRNILTESVGSSVAIAVVAMTALMPCGLRFSVDALLRSLSARDEKTPDDLDDRSAPSDPTMGPSLVPLALMALLALVYYGAGLQQTGPSWKDGTALHYALHVDRWTSASGVAIRESSGLLSGLTRAFWIAQLVIVPLALVPVARRITRPLAVLAMLLHGLVVGILFTLGLYGWTLVATALLLIPEEIWEAPSTGARRVAVYYDADCGICLWLCRLLKRLDGLENLTFHGNDDLPEGIDEDLALRTMVAVDAEGEHHTDIEAAIRVMRAVPALTPLGWLFMLPGLNQLGRWLYYRVADNRIDISVALGMGACGIPSAYEPESGPSSEETPAARFGARARSGLASVLGVGLLLAVAAQSEANDQLPTKTGLGEVAPLANFATWMRIHAPWGLWAPEPPKTNGALVVDGETRGGWQVDPLTGYAPDLELAEPVRARKGVLWEAYGRHIADDDYEGFRKEFRRYLTRGGWTVDTRKPENFMHKLTVYWVERPIPAPGEQASGEVDKIEVFDRRGRVNDDSRHRPKFGTPDLGRDDDSQAPSLPTAEPPIRRLELPKRRPPLPKKGIGTTKRTEPR